MVRTYSTSQQQVLMAQLPTLFEEHSWWMPSLCLWFWVRKGWLAGSQTSPLVRASCRTHRMHCLYRVVFEFRAKMPAISSRLLNFNLKLEY